MQMWFKTFHIFPEKTGGKAQVTNLVVNVHRALMIQRHDFISTQQEKV